VLGNLRTNAPFRHVIYACPHSHWAGFLVAVIILYSQKKEALEEKNLEKEDFCKR
jgi:hypothetical protein